jgi:hypothetical protein
MQRSEKVFSLASIRAPTGRNAILDYCANGMMATNDAKVMTNDSITATETPRPYRSYCCCFVANRIIMTGITMVASSRGFTSGISGFAQHSQGVLSDTPRGMSITNTKR